MSKSPPVLNGRKIDLAYEAFFQNDDLPYCDGIAAERFVKAVLEQGNQSLNQHLSQTLLPALFGPTDGPTKQKALNGIAATALKIGLTHPFANHDAWVLETHLAPFIEGTNRPTKDGERVIVFLAMMPYFVILREAMHLREMGYRVVLLSLSPLPEKLRGVFERTFHALADTRRCMRLMRTVLQKLEADIIHVQCWMWSYVFGRLALEEKKDAAVVCEFYDVTSIFAERDGLLLNWRAGLVDMDLAFEKQIVRQSDGVISRFDDQAVKEWFSWHEADTGKHLRLLPYATPAFTAYSDDKLSKKDGITRLVYLGSLIATDGSHPAELFPGAAMPSTFRNLLEQGFAVDVFHIPHETKGANREAFAEYYALAEDFEHFRLLPGVSPDKLSQAICRYDYGIMLYPHDIKTLKLRPLQEEAVISTKMFSYLEAGLPPLIIAEHKRMSDFIVDNNLGPRVPAKEIGRLNEILGEFDYGTAVENIKLFNQSHTMAGECKKLIALYDKVLP